jgi:hypothetical protein
MKTPTKLLLLCAVALIISSCERSDPYEEGMHWNYSIICSDGFKFKVLSDKKGTLPCLNSDGTHLKCDQKRY